MMKKEKTLKIALSSALLLAVAAAGVTMYSPKGSSKKQEEEQVQEQQSQSGDTPLSELAEGQKEAMESGGSEENETADVASSEADTQNTQALTGEENGSGEGKPSSDSGEPSGTDAAQPASDEAGTGQSAGSSDSQPGSSQSGEASSQTAGQTDTQTAATAETPVLNFTEDTMMLWPVSGEVLIDYSMDASTYFTTLDQYRYNSALLLSAAAGEPVQAAANGQVISISENEETGITLKMDLGNGYQAVYGQLKDLTVSEGQAVAAGTIIGYINDPTKYYIKEGANLYFAMSKDGSSVDPMLYIETVTE
jgi:murein DD-endopeptidase MepM/ murein hydrolase activator NlpD